MLQMSIRIIESGQNYGTPTIYQPSPIDVSRTIYTPPQFSQQFISRTITPIIRTQYSVVRIFPKNMTINNVLSSWTLTSGLLLYLDITWSTRCVTWNSSIPNYTTCKCGIEIFRQCLLSFYVELDGSSIDRHIDHRPRERSSTNRVHSRSATSDSFRCRPNHCRISYTAGSHKNCFQWGKSDLFDDLLFITYEFSNSYNVQILTIISEAIRTPLPSVSTNN